MLTVKKSSVAVFDLDYCAIDRMELKAGDAHMVINPITVFLDETAARQAEDVPWNISRPRWLIRSFSLLTAKGVWCSSPAREVAHPISYQSHSTLTLGRKLPRVLVGHRFWEGLFEQSSV
jgi:hypothetical protein